MRFYQKNLGSGLAARFGQPRNSLRSNTRCCFSSASQRLPTPQNQSIAPARQLPCIGRGLRGLAERNSKGRQPQVHGQRGARLKAVGTRASRFLQAHTSGDSTPGQDRVGPSRHRPIPHGWRPRTPRKTKQAPAGSLREARGAKEVPEALSNRNGEDAIAISPSRTRSKRHLAPHFLTKSRKRLDGSPAFI